ncbi:MAG: topoisomerase C-terminal repeat-containing protein [Ilumatobacteraceae bacterium]
MSSRPVVAKDGKFGVYVTDGETKRALSKGDRLETMLPERASNCSRSAASRSSSAGPAAKKAARTKKAAAKKAAPAKKAGATKSAAKKAPAKKAGGTTRRPG